MEDIAGVVIVGAGQAGFSCAAKLRSGGYGGPVTLIGEEPDAPYQRPPLSKAYLLDKMTRERLQLRPLEWYETNNIKLITGVTVERIDRAARNIVLSQGEKCPYGRLVLATGAAARTLPYDLARGLDGIFYLRNRSDIDRVRPELATAKSVLIIGGGYVGLETAAITRSMGRQVDLIEMASELLGRVASRETANAISDLHRTHGVKLWLGKGVAELTGAGRVGGAVLSDGTRLETDLVVVGIGALPRTELALACGLTVDNGIVVDAFGRTSDPAIYAAGDCANYHLPQGALRLESVGNAIDTGETVAQSILGIGDGYVPRPWFWSDQFDMKMQMAGQAASGDSVQVRLSPEEGRSHWYYRDGRLVAVDALNAPRAYQTGRRMIEAGLSPDPRLIVDHTQPLKVILETLQRVTANADD